MQTESELHECTDTVVENIEHIVSSSEQNHESFHIPHSNDSDDHHHNHTENANADLYYTIEEPHISIRSSFSNDKFNDIESNFHQSCNQVGDPSNHSININSFLTFNHDDSHANTSESPTIGNEMLNYGEDRDSYQNENYDGDVEDVNDEATDICEEVGNFCGGGN